MQKVIIDFETYYARDFSLKKMQIDEYVTDPRFKILGVGVKIGDAKPVWWVGKETRQLKDIDWQSSMAIFQNAYFDAFILSYWYKIKPNYICDTMSMGRALFGPDVSNSLAALAERLKVGAKGNELSISEGKEI